MSFAGLSFETAMRRTCSAMYHVSLIEMKSTWL